MARLEFKTLNFPAQVAQTHLIGLDVIDQTDPVGGGKALTEKYSARQLPLRDISVESFRITGPVFPVYDKETAYSRGKRVGYSVISDRSPRIADTDIREPIELGEGELNGRVPMTGDVVFLINKYGPPMERVGVIVVTPQPENLRGIKPIEELLSFLPENF